MNKEKKPFLIDVPVKINIWIRKELQLKQFDIIRNARPSTLFIQSDGGRTEDEVAIINECRDYIDSHIDWDCTVHRFYEEKNNGLYAMAKKVSRYIWERVDRCIFLEDDDIPAVSFFRFCAEMLERYKDDTRIQGISGFNPLGVYSVASSDYFFSGETNPWGTATWKRSIDLLYSEKFEYIDDDYAKKILKREFSRWQYKYFLTCAKGGNVDGHIPWGEYYKGLSRVTQNALYISPKYNLVSNHGCGDDATHSSQYLTLSKEEQNLYYSNTYELSFPLKHPKYVMRDSSFEKKVQKKSGFGHPLIRLRRRFVKILKTVRYTGISGLLFKYKKKKRNRNER